MLYLVLFLVCFQYWLIYSYHSMFVSKQSRNTVIQRSIGQNRSSRFSQFLQSNRTSVFHRTNLSVSVSSEEEEEEEKVQWDEGEVPWDFVEPKNQTSGSPFSKIPVLRGIKFSKNEMDKIIFLVM